MSVFRQHQYDNGLTLIAEPDPAAHTAAIGFFVKTGTRDETKPEEGVSHFLEHMMFKGTDRRSADDVNREFDDMGANYNAYTSHEQTVYYAHVLPEFLEKTTDLWCDMLRPALRTDDFDMEKNVILEEIGMYEDRPYWRLYEQLVEDYYGEHALGYRVLGTPDSIKDLTADQMRSYFESRYAADNIVVAAAGKFDADELIQMVEQRTSHWKPSGVTRDHCSFPVNNIDETLHDERVNRGYFATIWPGPSAQSSQRYAATVLANVLGSSDGSRLYWNLVDKGIADEADLSFQGLDQTGCFFGYMSCDPARMEKAEQIFTETVEGIADDLNEDEITRAKNKIATSTITQSERPMGRMSYLGRHWIYHSSHTPLREELENLMAVTTDDVQSLLAGSKFADRATRRTVPQKA